MFAEFLDDVFAAVSDVAIKVAPTVLPAAAAFGAVKLAGGSTKDAFIGAGVAAGVAGLVGSMGGAPGASPAERASIAPGSAGAPGAAETGALARAGISEGAISGGTEPGGAMLPQAPTGTQRPGLLSSLGITGADALKAGGQIIASLDDTDDKFKERELELLERRHTVAPVAWAPSSPLISRVTARGPGARRY